MQTPSHLAFSLFIWRKSPNWKMTSAVVFGALLPDLAMYLFYGYQKLNGNPEAEIWQRQYFLDNWQLFFDIFNSIPIFVLLAAIGHFSNRKWLYLMSVSAVLHLLCDLPLHNDDAHRHFLPLTHWRFISPVSYWDPKHYGLYALATEMFLAVLACVYLATGKFVRSIRVVAWVNLSLYITVGALALSFWYLHSNV